MPGYGGVGISHGGCGVHLFTYGSLMFEPVWRRVVRDCYVAEPAFVTGLQRWCLHGESYPGLWPGEPGDRVDGVLYRNISAADWQALDYFEGDQYQRQRWECLVGAEPVQAELYLISPMYRHQCQRQPWDPKRFEREQMAAFLRGCRDYLQSPGGV